MRVFLSAGEASGDAYGAALVREMQNLDSGYAALGVGGKRMLDVGVELIADSSHWGAISISQSLKVYPRVILSYYRAKSALASGPAGLFIPIDFGYANIRLARHAKNNGWKVLYFIPPASWRRDRQGKDLPMVTDAIATPFSWSAEILNRMGANAHWFGHPIKQLLRSAEVSKRHSFGSGAGVQPVPRVAVLPGSRRSEIEENLPVIAEALKGIDAKATFALAPATDLTGFRRQWDRIAPGRDDEFALGETYRVLHEATAAIVCSGTATLEAALCRCPMVVVYRVSKTVEMEAKIVRFKRPKYIALPNILLDRSVVPELVQNEANPEAIRSWIRGLLMDSPERRKQLADFEDLDQMLGPDDAITKTAALAQRVISGVGASLPNNNL